MKFAKLIRRNLFRNKLRSILTLVLMAAIFFFVATLLSILENFEAASNAGEGQNRLSVQSAISLANPLPLSHEAKIATVPGIVDIAKLQWLGAYYKEPKNFFANFAVDPAKLRVMLPELKMPDDQWQAFINDRQGAIVGRKLVMLHGFRPGQRITLKSPIYNQSVEFIIRGVCTGGDEKTLYFHHDYINELLPAWAKDQVSTFNILANSPEDVPRVAQAIDQIFANTDAPTKTESEREFALSFQAMMGGVKQFLYGIMAAITFSLLLVMGNTMAISVRERTKEVGTLKAIGFQRGTITILFLGEALLVACIGAAIGIGAASLIFRVFDLSLIIPNFISFVPTIQTLSVAFVLSLLVGVISVAYSAYRVSGLTIAEALRSTE